MSDINKRLRQLRQATPYVNTDPATGKKVMLEIPGQRIENAGKSNGGSPLLFDPAEMDRKIDARKAAAKAYREKNAHSSDATADKNLSETIKKARQE